MNETRREQLETTIEGLKQLVNRGITSVYIDAAIIELRHQMKLEERPPAAWTSADALADVADDMTAMMGPFNAVGDIPLFTGAQPMQDSEAREMLKRLAVIMTGSDSGGEIAALTVTAQSFVDRCKTLAKEREDTKQVDELVMWVKRLAHSLRKANPDSKLQSDAMDYLSRKGLIGVGDVLR